MADEGREAYTPLDPSIDINNFWDSIDLNNWLFGEEVHGDDRRQGRP